MTGTVTFNGSGSPVNGAQVVITNSEYAYSATADASGVYTIPGFVLDSVNNTFDIVVGTWGAITHCESGTVLNSSSIPLNFTLDQGFYDDFALDFGWTVNSTAISGIWERAEPFGAISGFTQSNPDVDAATDCSDKAYVTGNAENTTASADDVDNGNTVLISPVFNTTGLTDAWISYDAWFQNNGGSGSPNDTMIVTLFDGSTPHILAKYTATNFPSHTWMGRSYRVSDYTAATTNLKLQVMVSDYNPGHVVDGAFDVFQVTEGNPFAGIDEQVISHSGLKVYPNPTTAGITISNASILNSVQVIDMTGKIVVSKTVNDKTCVLDLSVLEHGIYSIRTVDIDGKVLSARIVKQ
jgi:hypothetical protein